MQVRKVLWTTSVAAALCVGVPRFFELNVGRCWDHLRSHWSFVIRPAPLRSPPPPALAHGKLWNWCCPRENWYYKIIYRLGGDAIFYSIGPFLFLSILSTRILFALGSLLRDSRPLDIRCKRPSLFHCAHSVVSTNCRPERGTGRLRSCALSLKFSTTETEPLSEARLSR